jgi:hypothetical protein
LPKGKPHLTVKNILQKQYTCESTICYIKLNLSIFPSKEQYAKNISENHLAPLKNAIPLTCLRNVPEGVF